MADAGAPIPDEFAEMLGALLEPGQEDAVAEVLEAALELDDEQLGAFLAAAAELVRTSRRPLRADELRALVPPRR
jgi:hypothetical protein